MLKKKLLVVVGSVYADVFAREGEALGAERGPVFAGGKGVNQAACATQLGCPTNLVGQVGKDVHAGLVEEDLMRMGVRLDNLNVVSAPTGQAVHMMESGSSIILAEGANVSWPRLDGGIGRLQPGVQQMIRCAAALLLQREIPDAVNLEAAKIAKNSNVPVILDCSGSEASVPEELLKRLTVLYSTDEHLPRNLHLATNEAVMAAKMCIKDMGVQQVLIKSAGGELVLVTESDETSQLQLENTRDIHLANDVLPAAYTVAFIESQPAAHALKFAACTASLASRSFTGRAILPDRDAVLKLVHER